MNFNKFVQLFGLVSFVTIGLVGCGDSSAPPSPAPKAVPKASTKGPAEVMADAVTKLAMAEANVTADDKALEAAKASGDTAKISAAEAKLTAAESEFEVASKAKEKLEEIYRDPAIGSDKIGLDLNDLLTGIRRSPDGELEFHFSIDASKHGRSSSSRGAAADTALTGWRKLMSDDDKRFARAHGIRPDTMMPSDLRAIEALRDAAKAKAEAAKVEAKKAAHREVAAKKALARARSAKTAPAPAVPVTPVPATPPAPVPAAPAAPPAAAVAPAPVAPSPSTPAAPVAPPLRAVIRGPDEVKVGQTATFEVGDLMGDVDQLQWGVSDGPVLPLGTDSSIDRVFDREGSYNVFLWLYDASGNRYDTVPKLVTVKP